MGGWGGKNQINRDRALMSIKMSMEARFGIELEGIHATIQFWLNRVAASIKTGGSDRMMFGRSASTMRPTLVS